MNKVTLDGIKAKITAECYLVLPDGRTTVCMLSMQNGYTIKGLSACVDAANFDIDLGRKYAYEDAIRQIWPLEGYLLAQHLYEGRAAPEPEKTSWTVTATDNGDLVAPIKRRGRPRKVDPEAPYGRKKDGTPKQRPGRKAA
jgi:Phage protein (N4 Gp49/phage Sf6 gene 66) family